MFFQACAGFAAPQVAAVATYAWAGFTAAQLENTPPAAYGGFGSDGLGKVPDWSLSNATQIAAIPAAACSGFLSTTIETVSVNGAAGFTAAQIGQLSPYGGCSGLTSPQFSALTPASYAGFTADCIVKVKSASLDGATAAGISNLRDSTCAGLSSSQTGGINPNAYSGFTAACFGSLTFTYASSGCAGLSQLGFPKLTVAALSAMTSGCITNTKASAWTLALASQTAALPAAACTGFKATQLGEASSEAYSGFTSQCVANWPFTYSSDGCSGVSAAGLGALSPGAFSGFTAGCVSKIPGSAWANATSQQTSLLDEGCTGFKANGLQGLSTSGYSGLRAVCVINLPFTYQSDGCYGITADGLSNMEGSAFSGFSSGCLRAIPGTSFITVKKESTANFTASACSGLSANAMKEMGAWGYEGLRSACLAQLSYTYTSDGCYGLSRGGLPSVQPSEIGGLTVNCISASPAAAWSNVFQAQIAMITPTSCNGFKALQMGEINDLAYSGFKAACLNQLPYTYSSDGCSGLSGTGVGRIAASEFVGWAAQCLTVAPADTFAFVNANQTASLDPAACAGIKAPHFENMTLQGYSGLQHACVGQLSSTYMSDGCYGLSAAGIPQMTPGGFSGFQSSCLSVFQEYQMATILPPQIQAIPADSCTGLRYLSSLQATTFSAITLPQILNLASLGVRSLSPNQLLELFGKWKTQILIDETGWSQSQVQSVFYSQALGLRSLINSGQLQRFIPLPADWQAYSARITWFHMILLVSNPSPAGWTFPIITSLNSSAAAFSFIGFTPFHVSNLTNDGASAITATQARYLLNDTVAALSPSQWSALSPAAVGGIQAFGWQNVSCSACVIRMSAAQVGAISVWAGIPCPIVGEFVQAQFSQTTQTNFRNFNLRRQECDQTVIVAPPQFLAAPSDSVQPGSPSSGPSGSMIGAIVGGTIGGALVIAVVVGVVYWRTRQRSGYSTL